MIEERFTEITDGDFGKWEGGNAYQGLQIIAVNEWKKEDKPLSASQVLDKPDSLLGEDDIPW